MLFATQVAAAPAQHTVSQATQQRIVFASDRDHPDTNQTEIYTMNTDGSDVQRLTTQGGTSPDWSPDGTRIVYMVRQDSSNSSYSDIYVMDADGSAKQRLTTTQDASGPDWSPDGTQIAFSRRNADQDNIYIMNSDGSNIQRLTSTGGSSPDWSPDGKYIAFDAYEECDPSFPFCSNYIHIVQVSNLTPIANTIGIGYSPRWSPDGKTIVFSVYSDFDGSGTIVIYSIDGSEGHSVPKEPLHEISSPSWSADGSKIIFTGYSNNQYIGDIYVINPDGTDLTRLTKSTANDFGPAWSPNLPPLTVALFTGDTFTVQRQCYEVLAIIRNNTSSPITKEISFQESAAYQRINGVLVGLPQGRSDVLRDCDTNTVLTTGGSISKSATIPANSTATYRFRLSHNWDWIERPSLSDEVLKLLGNTVVDVVGGGLIGESKSLVKILSSAVALSELLEQVQQDIEALPEARYTYTLKVPDISTTNTTVVTAEINPWQHGYLRGSITATAVSQILCPLSTFFSPAAPGCAAATGTSISLYFAAYGEIPTISTLQVTNLAAYTTLIEPPSIPVTLINTITDPAQRQFAQSYVTALSLQRAALASHANALDAAAAHDLQWDATQRHRAGLFLEQESRMLDQATRSGQTFLPTTAMPDATALQAIKDQLNSTGFSQSFITTSHEMGLSDAEIAVLRSTLIRIPVDEWPQPADMLVANVAYRQSQQNLANLIDPMVLLPLVQR